MGDLLERDSSVRSTGQTGGIVDSFFIRGFPVGEGNLGELAFDGVYGVASNYRVFTEYAERIEVVKGPSALLYGMSPNSAVGGVINVVPKRSLDEDLTPLHRQLRPGCATWATTSTSAAALVRNAAWGCG